MAVKASASRAARAILHPERMRLITLFKGRETLTARELHALAPGISTASLYRHLALLRKTGILRVAATNSNRGPVESSYALAAQAGATVDGASIRRSELDRLVQSLAAVMMGDFERYARSPRFGDPAAPPMFRAFGVDLTDEEYMDAAAQIERILTKRRPERAGRRRRMFYAAAVPDGA